MLIAKCNNYIFRKMMRWHTEWFVSLSSYSSFAVRMTTTWRRIKTITRSIPSTVKVFYMLNTIYREDIPTPIFTLRLGKRNESLSDSVCSTRYISRALRSLSCVRIVRAAIAYHLKHSRPSNFSVKSFPCHYLHTFIALKPFVLRRTEEREENSQQSQFLFKMPWRITKTYSDIWHGNSEKACFHLKAHTSFFYSAFIVKRRLWQRRVDISTCKG